MTINNMYSTISIFLVILATAFCDTDITNNTCTSLIGKGTCIRDTSCPYVEKLLSINDRDTIIKLNCGFEGLYSKVCCPEGEVPISYKGVEEIATNRPKQLSTIKPALTTTFAPQPMEQTDKNYQNVVNKTATNIPKHLSTLRPALTTTLVPQPMDQTEKIFPNRTVCGKYNIVGNRVYGGTMTQVDEHPWLARIRYKIDDREIFPCSAVLITDRYLLTAAHCMKENKTISIRLGEWNTKTKTDCYNEVCNEQTIDVNVSRILKHPTFHISKKGVDGDIALIQLKEAVTFTDFIQPICLPTSKYIASQDYSRDSVYSAAGWGLTEFESPSVIKRQVQLNAVPFEICRKLYNLKAEPEHNLICAGGTKGKDTCTGDSGGPLIKHESENYETNWYLSGIISFGTPRCGSEGVPGLYTRVSGYMDWIREVVSE